MRTEQLKYFIEVTKTGSIRTAADNLYMTQPALGVAIKNLEKELGYPLFERSHTGVKLTEYGEMTLAIATDILNKTRELDFIRYMYDHAQIDELAGQLMISTILTISLELLQRVVPAFSRSYPNIELVILERNSQPVLDDVLSGQSDLGFLSATEDWFDAQIQENCVLELLWEEKLYAIVRQSSELAKKKALSLKQISQYPLALMAFDQGDNSVKNGILANFPEAKIMMRSSNFTLTQHHILSTGSVGLAFVASVQKPQETFLPDLALVPISGNVTAGFYVVYKKNTSKLKLIRMFVDTLKEVHR